MLCAIDVGNTQTVVGLFEEDSLEHHWRVTTAHEATADEMRVELASLLALEGRQLDQIDGMVISSVVPNYTAALLGVAETLRLDPLVITYEIDLGISILYEPPSDVGADRLANAVAAIEKYGAPVIVVDFGTATTFDAITREGEYAGGAIAPGVEVSADALFAAAAKLPRVELVPPPSAIGKTTAMSAQSGILFGEAGMVDAMVTRIAAELGGTPEVIATGGLAALMAPLCGTVLHHEPFLTLEGLRSAYRRNR